MAFGDFFTEAFGFAFVVFGFGVSFGFLLLPRRAASSSILKHEGDLPQPHPKGRVLHYNFARERGAAGPSN